MGRSLAVATSILFGSLALGGAACTNSDGAIVVLQNQIPDEGCVIPNSLTSTFLPRGSIDTNAEGGYVFNPLVQNTAIKTESQDRVAIIEGAEVRITLQEGLLEPSDQLTSLTEFTARFSGAVQADGGFTSFSFVAIPKDLLTLMAPALADGVTTEVRVDVTVFGEVSGGSVESNKFSFWVDVCTGCMKVNQGTCADLSASFTARTGGVCNDLQDNVLDCCTDSTGAEVCPAAIEEEPTM